MRSKIEEEEMDTRYEDKDDDNISDDDQNMDDDNDDADNDDSDTDGMDNQDDDNDDLYPEENMLGSQKRNYIDEDDAESSKRAKLEATDPKLYRLPTMDELTHLRETQTLYHSNLFKLQMEELLLEVSMKSKHYHQLTSWLNKFSSLVKSLPASPVYQSFVTKWLKEKNICDPLASLPDGKGSFQFMAPVDVSFVGSFSAGTSITLNNTVDVMLILPKEIVKYKDYKDGRWLAKRSKYLCWLASILKEKADIVTTVHWTTHLGCTSRPVLQVTPAGKVGKKWKVNLFPVPATECLKLALFSPDKWTLTPSWYFGESSNEETQTSTPYSNWCCAIDVVMQDHHRLITNTISPYPNLCQGIKLIKLWLAQRRIDKGFGKMSGHVVSMLVAHLLQTRKINSQMSAYQVFRTVILMLESSDWAVKGISMDKDSPYDVPSLASLHNLYEVVFMDTSGLVNMMANLLTEDFLLLKHEATLALHMLNSSSVDSFEFLFMKNVEFYQAYDQILSIRLKKRDLKRILEKEPNFRNDLMDSLGDLRQLSWSAVLKLLKRGLGDRVKLLVPARGVESVWSTDLSPPKLKSSLMVGFVINQIASKALLTRGPSADDPGCEAFRNFWGKKSNLRRFQDGSFHEAVLWGDAKQPVAERRLFPGLISKYLLNLHYGLKKNLHYICSKTESVLQLENVSLDFAYGTGEEATFHVIQAYDGLTRKLRSLDLPLKITSVQSVSDVNRHTRVFPPLSRSLRTSKVGLAVEDSHLEFLDMASETPLFNYAIKVNVFLETSGKWPDDLIAIQAIKAEFYKTMASLLKKDKINVVPFPGLLQILWEGFVFHVKVCYRREIYLSRLVEKCEGILREEDTNDAIALEQQLEILPRLNTALASVQADHSSFGCGVRLAKRWLGSQLLLPHIPHIAVELLIAHLCTSPAPYDAPHTPHILFLRFLSLLATTDWKTTPILLNLRDTFSVEDVTEIHRRFTSERSSLPEMFIATAYELRGLSTLPDMEYRYKLTSFWTEESPSLQILYRCKQLASASLNFCTRTMLKPNADIKTIFRPCLNDFDVIMKLHSSQLSRREEALDQETFTSKLIHPYKHHSQEIMPVVMFDPAQLYLEELRDAFDHLALFFHDEHGGDIIGVVWRPTSLKKQELKIANYEGHQLTGIKNTKQIPNMEAILSDFEVMGMGLVQRITVNNKA